MDRAEAFEALPAPYAVALRMAADGAGDEAVAEAVSVEVDAVPALLEIGEAKLTALLSAPAADATEPDAGEETGSELGV